MTYRILKGQINQSLFIFTLFLCEELKEILTNSQALALLYPCISPLVLHFSALDTKRKDTMKFSL